jgi:transcription-repair coupling factor (superfamily II helicase)
MKTLIVNPLTTKMPNQDTPFNVIGLLGSATSLWLSTIKQKSLVIAANTRKAHQIQDDLNFFNPSQSSIIFPDWETLPYDRFSPLPEIISKRLRILNQLLHNCSPDVIITKASTLMMPLPPPEYIIKHCLDLTTNQTIDLEEFILNLSYYGYERVNNVIEPCQFALRGCILDLYPSGATSAFRIEFFDNQIDSIRSIDIESQYSLKPYNRVQILPAHEFVFPNSSTLDTRAQQLSIDPCTSLINKIKKRQNFGGIEYYLPLFHSKTATLFDYIDDSWKKIWLPEALESTEIFWSMALKQYDNNENPLTPKVLFQSPSQLQKQSNHPNSFHISLKNNNTTTSCLPEKTRKNPGLDLSLLQQFLKDNNKLVIVSQNKTRRSHIEIILKQYNIDCNSIECFDQIYSSKSTVITLTGYLHEGFYLIKEKLWLIRDDDLIASGVKTQTTSPIKEKPQDIEFNQLTINDPIVHQDFGVGLYKGLKTIEYKHRSDEFIILEYANKEEVFLPIHRMDLIGRYRGSTDNIILDRLGKSLWVQKKKIAQESIHKLAKELMKHYSEQNKQPGIPLPIPTELSDFSQEFCYDETEDQLSSIHTIIQKLQHTTPMDHLVCGDVGFGKTEVAMRAMFVATFNQFQCILLAPTTVLCEQHYQSISNRFHNWPISIGVLNRFNPSNKTMQDFNSGRIDLLVCTHKILHQSITTPKIALIVIDEEHKFGVKQKEKLCSLFKHSHKLALSATPIPRTLNMALSKFKSMSIIASPPPKRVPVKTFIISHNQQTIIEAIRREIFRGGQVYYLVNTIHKLSAKKNELIEHLPGLNIQTIHAKLTKSELQSIMKSFTQQDIQVLLCTTIIEAGIDIPNANTLIIENADHFGLAQLHQIRGRIGRSHHQAYAYFLVNDINNLAGDSQQRLMALSQHQSLGCGMNIALQDLEIRGAGTLLGKEQSGHIHKLGYTLYMNMLEQALNQSIKSTQEHVTLEHNLNASIPNTYITSPQQRLHYHHQIATSLSIKQLDNIINELDDQFGPLPDQADLFINLAKLKLTLCSMSAKHANLNSDNLHIQFSEKTKMHTSNLMELIHINFVKLHGPLNLVISFNERDNDNKNIIESINTLNKIGETV